MDYLDHVNLFRRFSISNYVWFCEIHMQTEWLSTSGGPYSHPTYRDCNWSFKEIDHFFMESRKCISVVSHTLEDQRVTECTFVVRNLTRAKNRKMVILAPIVRITDAFQWKMLNKYHFQIFTRVWAWTINIPNHKFENGGHGTNSEKSFVHFNNITNTQQVLS